MERNFSERTERMSCEVELRGFKKLLCVVDVNWSVLVPNFDLFCISSTDVVNYHFIEDFVN